MSNYNVGELLTRRAQISPEMPACREPERGLDHNYAQLEAKANRCAALLKAQNIGEGDRVALMLNSCSEFICLLYGAAKIGAVVVPFNTRLTAVELGYIAADSGSIALVYGSDCAATVKGLKESTEHHIAIDTWIEVGEQPSMAGALSFNQLLAAASDAPHICTTRGDDNLFIMYTSGTTGKPKGVVHTHSSTLWASLTQSSVIDFQIGDRIWAPLPMFHVGALVPAISSVQKAGCLVITGFDPTKAWEIIEHEKINLAGSVPAILNFMRQVPSFKTANLEHMRLLMSAAAPMPVELINIYAERGIETVQAYALTESASAGTFLDSTYAITKAGSIGKPMLYTEVRIVDEKGKQIAPGEVGEILMKGPHIMKEYWNNPEATANTLVDGWLSTGDMATIDEDGFIYIKDRIKDMIISGGENVYPAEVENTLMAHPAVLEAGVIGQPSEKWGESPFAVVAVKPGQSVDEQTLIDFCQGRLSRYKQPKGVAFVQALPRNASGKILKQDLRKLFPGPAKD